MERGIYLCKLSPSQPGKYIMGKDRMGNFEQCIFRVNQNRIVSSLTYKLSNLNCLVIGKSWRFLYGGNREIEPLKTDVVEVWGEWGGLIRTAAFPSTWWTRLRFRIPCNGSEGGAVHVVGGNLLPCSLGVSKAAPWVQYQIHLIRV